MLVGYARVSTPDQNFDLQRDALTHAGCERLFEQEKSGKAGTKRPEFEAALAYLRPTDVLVVWKLDRLGRSLVEMMRTIDALRVGGLRSFNTARCTICGFEAPLWLCKGFGFAGAWTVRQQNRLLGVCFEFYKVTACDRPRQSHL